MSVSSLQKAKKVEELYVRGFMGQSLEITDITLFFSIVWQLGTWPHPTAAENWEITSSWVPKECLLS